MFASVRSLRGRKNEMKKRLSPQGLGQVIPFDAKESRILKSLPTSGVKQSLEARI
jgi:hypothetical protein